VKMPPCPIGADQSQESPQIDVQPAPRAACALTVWPTFAAPGEALIVAQRDCVGAPARAGACGDKTSDHPMRDAATSRGAHPRRPRLNHRGRKARPGMQAGSLPHAPGPSQQKEKKPPLERLFTVTAELVVSSLMTQEYVPSFTFEDPSAGVRVEGGVHADRMQAVWRDGCQEPACPPASSPSLATNDRDGHGANGNGGREPPVQNRYAYPDVHNVLVRPL
jgi:hypothetical protein